jgi:hypothetical protein
MINLIENISKQFIYRVDQGATIDLRDFLDGNSLVKNYDIKIANDRYDITVQLIEFEKSKVRDVFFDLMRFIDYQTTFYTHEIVPEGTIYYLLTMSPDYDLGIYITITFC